jgi:hypothetical protein
MKIILLILTCFLTIHGMCQCDDIKTEKDKFTDVVTKNSPFVVDSKGQKITGENIIEVGSSIIMPAKIERSDDPNKLGKK